MTNKLDAILAEATGTSASLTAVEARLEAVEARLETVEMSIQAVKNELKAEIQKAVDRLATQMKNTAAPTDS